VQTEIRFLILLKKLWRSLWLMRWQSLFAMFASALLLTGVVILRSGLHLNEKSYERIAVGMTQEEVEVILGCPAGNYSTPGTTYFGSGPWIYWLHPEGCSRRSEPAGGKGDIVDIRQR
jgi:hypothetical protein